MNSEALEIITISRKIVQIELDKDADALAPYITEDDVGIDPSGALIDKDVSVGRYRRDDFSLTEHGVSDISVSVIGDTALEIGIMALKGHLGTFEFGGRYRYTHFWLKTPAGWKVRASQLTPILRD
ncbi:nuclear transport factor 2 family protein [Methylomicrobium lacus]|uniref:nuclear transport factor 2 family protein n=1 Tax=Methylomicrobium lacus TaxID=136992 RepID=UPI0035A8F136